MANNRRKSYQSYWEKNIQSWGKFYLNISHSDEELDAHPLFSRLYKATIGRVEARLMQKRYIWTMEVIEKYITSGMHVVDIGCGTGIFTVEIIKRGASVTAIDFTENALSCTKNNIIANTDDGLNRCSFLKLDVSKENIPKCDLAIAMGVTPYIASQDDFLKNALPFCDLLAVSFVDQNHFANRLRSHLSWLNIRNLYMADIQRLDNQYKDYGFILQNRTPLGTGFLDIISK